MENDVHVLGVSSLAAGHKTLVPQVLEELKKYGKFLEQKKVQKRGIKWRFYKYIVKFNGQYTDENFTEEAVFKVLFGKHEDFVQSKISKLKK